MISNQVWAAVRMQYSTVDGNALSTAELPSIWAFCYDLVAPGDRQGCHFTAEIVLDIGEVTGAHRQLLFRLGIPDVEARRKEQEIVVNIEKVEA